MSGKNNVNPDHYKTGGRDRPNESRAPGPRVAAPRAGEKPRRANFIPGALPVGEAPPRRRRARRRKAA
jgi:hypothetical protein